MKSSPSSFSGPFSGGEERKGFPCAAPGLVQLWACTLASLEGGTKNQPKIVNPLCNSEDESSFTSILPLPSSYLARPIAADLFSF